MSEWSISTFDCMNVPGETLIMSLFCSPCQFGLTHAKAHSPEQSALSYCVAYGFNAYVCYVAALALTPVPPVTPAAAALIASCASTSAVGMYAGSARTRLRRKYGIEGSGCDDCLLHTFFHQCALAQEANEVLTRESAVDVAYEKITR